MTDRDLPLVVRSADRESIWLFVRVIDNFGDAGVAWRLALALAQKFDGLVHVWIDDVAVLTQLVPAEEQRYWRQQQKIEIWRWQDDEVQSQLVNLPDPQLVIETFGCEVPAAVQARMVQCKPLWLNWEYFTVEAWASGVHRLPSLQPNGVSKYFWLMGLTADSGGLLREEDYCRRRADFLASAAEQRRFRQQYGLPATHEGQLWLIFAYHAAIFTHWLAMWQAAGQPMTLWLAGGQVIEGLRRQGVLPAEALCCDGEQYVLGSLTLVRIPFVPQRVFDALLWLADGAIVRGEDSMTRALLAGLPFFWHIYAQQEQAHMPKLHAFWQQVAADWPPGLRADFMALSDELNGAVLPDADRRLAIWQRLQQNWPQWQTVMRQYADELYQLPAAMEKLASFRHHTLK